jgi:formate-dependent phosphoribosylglycinamide formyltransferase (GAR transformylase)
MALVDDLSTVVTDLDTLKAVVEQAVTDLTTVPATPADTVLSSVVTALESAGYTVTPPATTTTVPVTDGTDVPLDTPA